VVFEKPDTYKIIEGMNMSECFNFVEFYSMFSHCLNK
jgi:hypothetical protein